MLELAETVRVVDVDAHMTERHDLFTERAPKGYEDKVPHVERIDGVDMWVVDGDTFGRAGSGGNDRPRRQEAPLPGLAGRYLGDRRRAPRGVGPGERLRLMDELGIDAQVLYPNSIGIGGQNLGTRSTIPWSPRCASRSTTTRWPRCRRHRAIGSCRCRSCLRGTSTSACVRPKRCAELGYRGVNMTADPQDSGSPDLGDPAWDPFWEVCAGLGLPVHFHIGASQTALSYFGTTYWPSQDDYVKPAIGGASLFQNNSRLLLNSAYSGMFDRHPDLKMVSVESGIGWVPFMLEAMDYELEENAAGVVRQS